ncbi:bifunctional lytic transglycosylase/C40 family peptidase [Phaeacidiphilus oryzae]|uniref:bifunctional lytic transglycosylase/C40 family peptidase n=1 Tax=Phaeacidiphilus oryzae TaxID=348818 RepID=UPI002AFF7FB3|nr:bifunctional lytic transglycosylase/C40 family peptidase [Phaeacidiphilus oryzae]
MLGAFLALLVVGTYTAAGSLSTANGASNLATGTVPSAYAGLIQQWGRSCSQLTPPLLAAQLYQESGFNPRAVSGAGAEGIAQFMPGTWATHGIDANGDGTANVWDPQDAIPSAAEYDCELAKEVAKEAGDPVSNMLAAYNAGPYAVISSDGVPGISQTQNYVTRIKSLAQSFTATTTVSYSGQAAGAIYYAQSKLGTPYLWGGEGLASQGYRFDCSGLTQAAYASVGIKLPRVANDQWYAGPHPSRSQLQPGDLVFYATDLNDPRSIHHVGIYVGGGYMIDAPHTGASVRYDPVFQPDYIGATRVTASGASALPALQPDGSIANGASPATG